ncbi:hypothetical protein P4V01_32645 [Bacillus thuringiensis]|nr:hypothetical protein [Bacillus thuringiensis]
MSDSDEFLFAAALNPQFIEPTLTPITTIYTSYRIDRISCNSQ